MKNDCILSVERNATNKEEKNMQVKYSENVMRKIIHDFDKGATSAYISWVYGVKTHATILSWLDKFYVRKKIIGRRRYEKLIENDRLARKAAREALKAERAEMKEWLSYKHPDVDFIIDARMDDVPVAIKFAKASGKSWTISEYKGYVISEAVVLGGATVISDREHIIFECEWDGLPFVDTRMLEKSNKEDKREAVFA